MENTLQLHYPLDNYCINKNGDLYNIKTKYKLTSWKNNQTYLTYTLMNKECCKKKNYNIHRLLGLTFLDNPNNYPCIDHIDRNKQNNSLDNLRWVSYQDNAINKPSYNPFGRGVYETKNKKRFFTCLFRDRKKIYLGSVNTQEEARILYEKSVEKYNNSKKNNTQFTLPI
tara:strand:- start:3165 stop:3674 length:510 start_codon:yes stop_codon:yes gene_type:complete